MPFCQHKLPIKYRVALLVKLCYNSPKGVGFVAADLEQARLLLESGEFTCVFCKAEQVITCKERGVKPLLALLEANQDLQGYSVADKVVGKAAAMLYVCMHVRQVYAPVMSAGAERTLLRHGIAALYDKKVERIQNRRGDGLCPMETAVWNVDDPKEALKILKNATK